MEFLSGFAGSLIPFLLILTVLVFVHEAGHFLMANPLMAGKDAPYVYPPLPEFAMGMLGRGLHLNMAQLLILFRFIAPAGLFLLIYFLVFRMSGGKPPAGASHLPVNRAHNLANQLLLYGF